MKLLISAVFLVFSSYVFCQDSTFVKYFYGGSVVNVPDSSTWKIEKAYISSGDGYNIQISLKTFKEEYLPKEKISFPYYIAEMELLTDRSSVSYIVTIRSRRK
jgi:hypothetical protein